MEETRKLRANGETTGNSSDIGGIQALVQVYGAAASIFGCSLACFMGPLPMVTDVR